jgi:hypothetical protein
MVITRANFAGSIASTMSLVADDASLLSLFNNLDVCTTAYLQQQVSKQRFKLDADGSQIRQVQASSGKVYVEC